MYEPNPANGTEMILHDTGGDYRLRIGSTTTATVGIGRQYNASYHSGTIALQLNDTNGITINRAVTNNQTLTV